MCTVSSVPVVHHVFSSLAVFDTQQQEFIIHAVHAAIAPSSPMVALTLIISHHLACVCVFKLKGQFMPKSNIHIFPLTCGAIY